MCDRKHPNRWVQENFTSLCILYVHNWEKSTLSANDNTHQPSALTITKLPK
jgi:hypothetical protein